jgi:hypothetical protein
MNAKCQEVFGYHYHLLLARRYLQGESSSIMEERHALEKLVKVLINNIYDFYLQSK